MKTQQLLHSANFLRERLRSLLSIDGTVGAFAYGSGIYSQQQARAEMIDLMVVVQDPISWHTRNLQVNYAHYSSLGLLGPGAVSGLGSLGPGVYFNPYVDLDGLQVKYGVISLNDLVDDLHTWKWLYLAGRLHKPTLPLLPLDSELLSAIKYNTRAAVAAAFLTLSDTDNINHLDGTLRLTRTQLYTRISELSYRGDLRLTFGAEHPDKIYNIVQHNIDHFDTLYDEALRPFSREIVPLNLQKNGLSQNETECLLCPPNVRAKLHENLPPGLPSAVHLLNARLTRRVFVSSMIQSVKGILTAGPTKALNYAASKRQKGRMTKAHDASFSAEYDGGDRSSTYSKNSKIL